MLYTSKKEDERVVGARGGWWGQGALLERASRAEQLAPFSSAYDIRRTTHKDMRSREKTPCVVVPSPANTQQPPRHHHAYSSMILDISDDCSKHSERQQTITKEIHVILSLLGGGAACSCREEQDHHIMVVLKAYKMRCSLMTGVTALSVTGKSMTTIRVGVANHVSSN